MTTSHPRSRGRWLRTLMPAAVVIVAAILTGCASPAPSGGGERIAPSLGALFDQYLNRSDLSSFERDVLTRARQSGRISVVDYENAHAREAQCMAAGGYTITYKKLPNGLYKNTPHLPATNDNSKSQAQADAFMNAAAVCSQGVTRVIEALYTVQQGNPDLFADPYEAAVQCLRKAGLVPGDYSAKTFAAQWEQNLRQAPFDPNSDAAQACLTGAGIAFASAPEAGR